MTGPRRPRVLLADDHLLVAEALRSMLEPEFDLVGVVEDGRQMVEAAQLLHPDVIVADVTMPHLNGIDALTRLREGGDQVPVVFLTMHRDVAFARRALEAGASGFVLKHSASVELITAVRAALEGKTYLTPQLAGEVLDVMRRGRRRRRTRPPRSRFGSARCCNSSPRAARPRRSPRASRSRRARSSSTSTR